MCHGSCVAFPEKTRSEVCVSAEVHWDCWDWERSWNGVSKDRVV